MAYDNCVTETNTDKLILQKARDIVWSERRSPCVYVAIGQVAHSEPGRLAHPALRHLGFGSIQEAFDWNDHPHRTKEEVLARFDSAIARLSITGERDE